MQHIGKLIKDAGKAAGTVVRGAGNLLGGVKSALRGVGYAEGAAMLSPGASGAAGAGAGKSDQKPEWTPAPSMAEVAAGAVLRQGMQGPAVTQLQQWLTQLGFGVQATGRLGPTTAGVIQSWQAAYGVEQNGMFGPTGHGVMQRALQASVTLSQIQELFPDLEEAQARQYLPLLNAAMFEANISNNARKAAFLAQVGHESVGLTAFEEYASGADYEGRRDLGNTQPGDGRRYKGRGPIQITGRANYRQYGELLGVDLENHPELAATPELGLRIAGAYWTQNGLNTLADEGRFDAITERINGGQNGRADRRSRHRQAQEVLSREGQ